MNRQLLAELARPAPLLPGKDQLAFLDIDSMQKRFYGHKKQGARFGHTKITGLGAATKELRKKSSPEACCALQRPLVSRNV